MIQSARLQDNLTFIGYTGTFQTRRTFYHRCRARSSCIARFSDHYQSFYLKPGDQQASLIRYSVEAMILHVQRVSNHEQ